MGMREKTSQCKERKKTTTAFRIATWEPPLLPQEKIREGTPIHHTGRTELCGLEPWEPSSVPNVPM